MSERKVKMVVNGKGGNEYLSPAVIYEDIYPKIDKDEILRSSFPILAESIKSVSQKINDGTCKGCQINNQTDLVHNFVREMKALDADRLAPIHKLLGKRVWFTHANHFVNVVTNEVEKIKYEERVIPAPRPLKKDSPPDSPKEPVEVVEDGKIDGFNGRKIIFKNFQAPGDIVMMTAAIRDLHSNHPGKFQTDVRTNSMPIWENNPYITRLEEGSPGVEVFSVEYPLIHQSNQGPFHFSEGFTAHFEDLLGVQIKRRIGKGHIVIGPNEEMWGSMERVEWFRDSGHSPDVHFWIVNAGWKNDFTAKMWPADRYQAVIDHFKGRIVFVQIGHASHNHPDLKDTINLVGKTDDRQLIRLVWASSGVLTPCSYPMTLAAAAPIRPGACNGRRERPCVVIAGGREPSGWQAYTNHQFIHTCGALPCCDCGGCWISRIKPIGDGDDKDKINMCHNVVDAKEGVELPFCMDMITADEVIRRMEMYYAFYVAARPKTHTHNKR